MKEYYIFYYKHPETYVYKYDSSSRDQLTQLINRQASNPDLSLTWYDAAIIVKTAKELSS